MNPPDDAFQSAQFPAAYAVSRRELSSHQQGENPQEVRNGGIIECISIFIPNVPPMQGVCKGGGDALQSVLPDFYCSGERDTK